MNAWMSRVSAGLCFLACLLPVRAAASADEAVAIVVPSYYGIEPRLTLAASATGGPVLQGVSTITLASHEGKGVPFYDGTDSWLFNGQTLIKCTSSVVSPGCDPANASSIAGLTYYYGKIETFLRIGYDGGTTWHVWDKKGTEYKYVRQVIYNPGAGGYSALYPLTSIKDTVGHQVSFTYTAGAPGSPSDNNSYLTSIQYGNDQVTLSFLYEPRPDVVESGFGAWGNSSNAPTLLTMTQRLSQVKVSKLSVTGVDTPIRYYNIAYTLPPSGQGRSIVSSIKLCGNDRTTCLPASKFSNLPNRGNDGDFGASGGPTQFTNASDWIAANDPQPLQPFPATAITERSGSWTPGWSGELNPWGHSDDFFVGGAWGKPTMLGDYDGDGRPDAFFLSPVPATDSIPYVHLQIRTVVNLPSDPTTPGQANRFSVRETETGQKVAQAMWGYTNEAKADAAWNAFVSSVIVPLRGPAGVFLAGNGWKWADYPYKDPLAKNAINSNVQALDVNGDGLSDFVALNYHAANETPNCVPYDHYAIAVVVNSGTFTSGNDWIYGTQETAIAFGAPKYLYFDDVNGDGRTDIMMVTRSDYKTVLNAEDETASSLSILTMLSNLASTGPNHSTSAADLNNAFSSPSVQAISSPSWITEFDINNQFFAGDFNGDGKTDWVMTTIHDANRAGDTASYKHYAFRTFLSTGGTGVAPLFQDVGESDVLGLSTDPVLQGGLGSPATGPQLQWFLGDYNGDGLLDIGFQSGHLNCDDRARAIGAAHESFNFPCTVGETYPHDVFTTLLSRGDGQWMVGQEWDTGMCDGLWGWNWGSGSYSGYCSVTNLQYHSADMNGDGLVDLTRTWGVPGNVFIKHFFSDGSGSTWDQRPARQISTQPSSSDMLVADMDGDGYNDLTQITAVIDQCHDVGWLGQSCTSNHVVSTAYTPPFEGNSNDWKTGDWNGDGRLDAVYVRFLVPGLQLRTVLRMSDGAWNSLAPQDITGGQKLTSSGVQNIIAADIDGDGRTDLVYVAPYLMSDGSTFGLGVYTYRFDPAINQWNLTFDDGHAWVGSGGTDGLATGGVNSLGWMPADVNGDGKTDLIRVRAGPVQGSGFQVFVLISNGDGTWTYSAFNNQSSRYVVFDDSPQQVNNWKVADLNGDGRSDLFRVVRSGSNNFRVDSLIAGSFDPVYGWFKPVEGLEMTSRGTELGTYTSQVDVAHWQVGSINRDGIPDLLKVSFAGYDQTGIYKDKLVVEMLSGSGNGFFRGALAGPTAIPASPAYPFYALLDLPTNGRINSLEFQTADLNNDGLSDLTQFSADYNGATNPSDKIYASTYLFHENKTGLTDLSSNVLAERPYAARVLSSIDGRVHTSGGGFSPSRRNLRRWTLADVDGDGVLDAFNIGFNPDSLSTQPVSILTAPGLSSPGDLLGTVTNSLGAVTKMTYKPSTIESRINDPSTNCRSVGIRQVVDSLTTEGAQVNYTYECPHYSFTERQFLGWESTTAKEPVAPVNRPTTNTVTRQLLTDQCLAQPSSSTQLTSLGDHVISQVTNTYSTPGTSPPYHCAPATTESHVYNGADTCNPGDPCQTITTHYFYDAFNNLTSEIDDGVAASGDERTTVWGYGRNQNPEAYIVGIPDYTATFNGTGFFDPFTGIAAGDLKSLTAFCYDQPIALSPVDGLASCPTGAPAQGLLTGTIAITDSSHPLAWRGVPMVRSSYDSYGNVVETRDANDNASTTMYDTFYHQFPTTTCNALHQCTTTHWDFVLGVPTDTVDVNGNWQNLKTYDPLGRLTTLTRHDCSITTYDYNHWDDKTQRNVDERSFSAHNVLMAETKTFSDGLGRTYETSKSEVDSNGTVLPRTLTQRTTYTDQTNHPYTVSLWSYNDDPNAAKETYYYDEALRQVKVVHPDSTFASAAFSADQNYIYATSTDESGHIKQVAVDGYGRPAQTVEQVGDGTSYTTRQSYDALGRLTALIDNAGHPTTFEYDALSRKTRSISPDTGTTTFEYDNAGNLTRQQDQKGNVLRFSYDALNRKLFVQHSDQSVAAWNYDESGHGASVGQLTSVVDSSALGCPDNAGRKYVYDALGRVTSSTNCVLGTSYTMATSYDDLGRLKTLTYPGPETVSYSYDPAGLLYSVSGYVKSMTYDANSDLTSITYNNGVSGLYTYDPKRLWLSTASFTPGGRFRCCFLPWRGRRKLYDATYTYYADGLLNTSSSTTNPMNDTFRYDGLHRLTTLSAAASEALFAESITYDPTGRMQSRNGAAYQYNDPNHLHAVTQVGASASYVYDANGSLLSRNGNDFVGSWNDENNPTQVTTSSGMTINYVYSATGSRVAEQPSNGLEKRFFGKFLEYSPSNGKLTKYYFAGPLILAQNSANTVNYFHADRLGSTRLLTDSIGRVTAGYDYKAFGEQIPRGGRASTDLRFTGQRTATGTGLANYTNLIFMNARLYDPFLARFISADTLIADKSKSAALDQYAFGYNNPISNTDPTGHEPEDQLSAPPLVAADAAVTEPSEWIAWENQTGPQLYAGESTLEHVFNRIIHSPCDVGQTSPCLAGPLAFVSHVLGETLALPARSNEFLADNADLNDERAWADQVADIGGFLGWFLIGKGGAAEGATGLGALPEEATIIASSESYVVYEIGGQQRIRFAADQAVTLQEATPGRNYTADTLAGLDTDGNVHVIEGRHRAIGAAQGDVVPPELGGVAGRPGVLDYEYQPTTVQDRGVPVKGLSIDHAEPEMSTPEEAEEAWKTKFNVK
jgi:RHS repeat-associated protein